MIFQHNFFYLIVFPWPHLYAQSYAFGKVFSEAMIFSFHSDVIFLRHMTVN